MTPGFVDRFALSRLHRGGLGWLTASLIAAALGMSSCARLGERSSVVVTPTRSSAAAPTLAAIIGNQLQSGHYASGERALRQYLQQHPGDRAAQDMLRQLTVDPVRGLGSRWRTHVVQPGDSYSTLADRYLGDANKFLILARYNGSTNPSLLRAGQTLRIPLSASRAASVTTTPAVVREAAPNRESASAQARRLQDESVSLLARGQRTQALARLEQALTIDPGLQPTGTTAPLRSQLLDSYHERAIVLYRDQQLNQAIALWNRVLAIAPDYEPAVVYRTRALELQQRLKQY